MQKSLGDLKTAIGRPAYFLAAVGLVVTLSSSLLGHAAGAQVQNRSITMSDSGVSGGTITSGVGSGTGVSYQVSFKAASSYTLKGVVVDFCSGSGGTPFIGDSTCAAPTSFTVGGSPTVDTSTSPDNIGSGWTAASLNSGQTLTLSNSTGTSLTSGTSYIFTVSGVTNPSTLGSFYARILTYTSSSAPASYTHGAPGSYQDYGGIALTTANVVQLTAKVQETLTFCVSAAGSGGSNPYTTPACSDATTPAVTLGHGSNNTLDTSAVDTSSVYTLESTNALHGIIIRMHNSNACGGLSTDAGTTCLIPAAGAGGGTTTSTITAGTAGFGLYCADGSGGTGTVTADANYNDGVTTNTYAMDTTSSANVTTTYGDQIASATAPLNSVTNKLTFAATASSTTPAGIYAANLALIATGTY